MRLTVFLLSLILFVAPTASAKTFNCLFDTNSLTHLDEIITFDEYQQLPIGDEKIRLDAFLSSIRKNDQLQGLIIFRLNKNESRKKKLKRFKTISKHFEIRKAADLIINLVFVESDQESTVIYLQPSEISITDFAYFDKTENYKIIKVEDLEQKINELFPKK